MKLEKYEKQLLEAYLLLPSRKLLRHQFELEEDYIAGLVSRFLHGERFDFVLDPFSDYENDVMLRLIRDNKDNHDGIDLLTSYLLTQTICNIINKYRKK